MSNLFILPDHFWEMVFNELQREPRNVRNANLAMPFLSFHSSIQKRKPKWYAGMLAISFAKWNGSGLITEAELLSVRATSPSAKADIDEWLENQPALKAYHPEDRADVVPVRNPNSRRQTISIPHVLDTIWNTKGYLRRIPWTWTKSKPEYFGGVLLKLRNLQQWIPFQQQITAAKFLTQFGHYEENQNPFLGRMLTIEVSDPSNYNTFLRGPYRNRPIPVNFVCPELMDLHRKFGHHIWYWKVRLLLQDLDPESFSILIQQIPNMKSLHLELINGQGEINGLLPLLNSELRKYLPEIPKLETLKVNTLHYSTVTVLLEKYSSQLYRLEMELFDMYRSFAQPGTIFPKLTELDVTINRHTHSSIRPFSGLTVENVFLRFMSKLESDFLSKLVLIGPELLDTERFTFSIDQVIVSLLRHRELIFLDIGRFTRGIVFKDEHLYEAWEHNLNCEFLSIRDNLFLTYNFLQHLPKLRKLQLFIGSVHRNAIQMPDTFIRIRREIEERDIYRSNIWEKLPLLEEVELVLEMTGVIFDTFTFTR